MYYSKKKSLCFGIMGVFLFLVLGSWTAYAVPQLIHYQGFLADSGGAPLNGAVDITFSFYDSPTGGTEFWSENHTQVMVTDGIFNVLLGSINPLTPAILEGDRYLGMAVGTDQEMSPRQRIASVAYAIVAGHAESVAAGGVDTASISDDSVTTSKLVDSSVGEPKIATGAVSGAKLADNSVTGSKIVDGSVSASDIADGSGSGLDADLLDGHDSSYFDSRYVNVDGDVMSENTPNHVLFVTNNGGGNGIDGYTANTDDNYSSGGDFTARGLNGRGVSGWSTGAQGYGVFGNASGAYGRAVDGYASDTGNGPNFGGYFQSLGSSGRGVYGLASNTGDVTNYGGYFEARSTYGNGVYGSASGANGHGLEGGASGANGHGVHGLASNTGDVKNYGGYFEAAGASGRGVFCYASNTGDVYNYGGEFRADGTNGRGVYADVTGPGGQGVYASASNTGDVWNYGGIFTASGKYGRGVYGSSLGTNGYGVYGRATGLFAYAGYFEGDVTVLGELTATVKTFVQPHPTDPSKEIVYVCLEGGENGVYVRGHGQLEMGEAEVKLPEHFALVAAKNGITAQITPRDGEARGYLYVKEASPDHLVVAESGGGTSDAGFDYLVMGVRRGFEDHQVIRENRHMKPDREMSQEEYEQWLGLPKNRGMRQLLIENGTLTPEGKVNQETALSLGWKLGPKTRSERMEIMHPEE